MVGKIASRVAAYKLATIIAVLLIPILYFGANIGLSLRQEGILAQKELQGAAFLNLVLPVMLDASEGKTNANNVDKLLKDGAPLAQSLGVSLGFNDFITSLSFAKVNYPVVLKKARDLNSRIGITSEIEFDSTAETYFLAVANSEYLPAAIGNFAELKKVILQGSEAAGSQTNSITPIILAVGSLNSSTHEIAEKIANAAEFSSNPAVYESSLASIKKMTKDMGEVLSETTGNSIDQNHMNLMIGTKVSSIAANWGVTYRATSETLRQIFIGLLEQRKRDITAKIMTIIWMSLGTISLGLGTAVAMFRNTLRKLDEVEMARSEAEASKDMAEGMSRSLTAVNEDMIKVNTQLAHNMRMLEEAQDQLVKKGRMEQMGQLTATIAHELRNPLGAVRTSAFLIERKLKGKELGVETQMARINNGITRCDDIITQLLDFSRSKQLSPTSADLDSWLIKVVEEEAQRLPSLVSIECHLGMNGQNVPFDASRLQRAIINLVANGSEAMVGNGEDPNRIVVSNPKITISTMVEAGFALISIMDNGPGISSENLLKIREPLFTTKSFGTGLGLPAVEQIAAQHGGTLDIKSELGSGSEFIIRLPASEVAGVAA